MKLSIEQYFSKKKISQKRTVKGSNQKNENPPAASSRLLFDIKHRLTNYISLSLLNNCLYRKEIVKALQKIQQPHKCKTDVFLPISEPISCPDIQGIKREN